MMTNNGADSRKIKVIYIAGAGRSGSTLLDGILGQVEDFFTVGELRLWDRSYLDNRICGCGQRLRSCEFWGSVLNRAFGDRQQAVAREMARFIHTPLLVWPRKGLSEQQALMEDYLDKLERIYDAVYDMTGSKILVDSSKFPYYARALGMVPSIDLYVVHLVRDPRAVAYSWDRQKDRAVDDKSARLYNLRSNAAQCSLKWDLSNLLAEDVGRRLPGRYLRIRYEDLTRRPRQALAEILSFVGEGDRELPIIGERQIRMVPNHSVSGNPVRFKSGVVEIKLDEEWRGCLAAPKRAVVNALTWPLLIRYCYLKEHETKSNPTLTT